MWIAEFTVFAASRKEPLIDLVERVRQGFARGGHAAPVARFRFGDAPAGAEAVKRISAVERLIRRWPQLEPFARRAKGSDAAYLTNADEASEAQPVDYEILAEIARGVPNSFPLHNFTLHLSAPEFAAAPGPLPLDAEGLRGLMRAGVDVGGGFAAAPGVRIRDSWGVNGRQRALSALRIAEADPAAKTLPPAPVAVQSALAACGKAGKTTLVPVVFGAAVPDPSNPADTPAEARIREIVQAQRASLPALAATLPHAVPLVTDIAPTGPRKPDLVEAFTPLGYDCMGGAGVFALSRRTPGHLSVTLRLDVGTWSDAVTASYQVAGMIGEQAFKATLSLPVSPDAAGSAGPYGQFPIRGAERWRRIVENLAALVAELDRGLAREVEAAAGPSPEWFRPPL